MITVYDAILSFMPRQDSIQKEKTKTINKYDKKRTQNAKKRSQNAKKNILKIHDKNKIAKNTNAIHLDIKFNNLTKEVKISRPEHNIVKKSYNIALNEKKKIDKLKSIGNIDDAKILEKDNDIKIALLRASGKRVKDLKTLKKRIDEKKKKRNKSIKEWEQREKDLIQDKKQKLETKKERVEKHKKKS